MREAQNDRSFQVSDKTERLRLWREIGVKSVRCTAHLSMRLTSEFVTSFRVWRTLEETVVERRAKTTRTDRPRTAHRSGRRSALGSAHCAHTK